MNELDTTAVDESRARLAEPAHRIGRAPWRTLGLGLAAGVGASLCCLPVLLLLAGVGGAWMGTLTAMEPYRPYFVGLTLVFLGLGFHKLYLMPRACADERACATPPTLRRQRALFWTITVLMGLLIGIPWYTPYLIG